MEQSKRGIERAQEVARGKAPTSINSFLTPSTDNGETLMIGFQERNINHYD